MLKRQWFLIILKDLFFFSKELKFLKIVLHFKQNHF